MKNKYINFFKVFFPSWEFFDEIEDNFVLKYRFSLTNIESADWQLFNLKIKRHFLHFFFNPKGNLLLNIDSNLQLLANSINEFIQYNQVVKNEAIDNEKLDITQNYHYQIIKNYIADLILNTTKNNNLPSNESNTNYKYQFKLCNQILENDKTVDEDLFLSAIHNSKFPI